MWFSHLQNKGIIRLPSSRLPRLSSIQIREQIPPGPGICTVTKQLPYPRSSRQVEKTSLSSMHTLPHFRCGILEFPHSFKADFFFLKPEFQDKIIWCQKWESMIWVRFHSQLRFYIIKKYIFLKGVSTQMCNGKLPEKST